MSPHNVRREAIKNGYRSGLEYNISLYLKRLKHKYDYESIKIEWEDVYYRTYTPDFILNNGIIIETKGRFRTDERKKHLCITLLGDDETWTEDGMVVLIDTEEAKEWYNEEYEEDISEFGWEELQECDIATLIHKDYRAPEKMNAEYLLDFYMTAKCLGFDEVIRDTMEGLKK